MSVQSSQDCVAAMQTATTSRGPTAASVLRDTSLQPMGRLVLVSFMFPKSIAHQPLGCEVSHRDRKNSGVCAAAHDYRLFLHFLSGVLLTFGGFVFCLLHLIQSSI